MEYDEQRGSNIAPHIDDVWLWGERIVGINILSDTAMTFYKENVEDNYTIEIELPFKRRGVYILSGASRFEWQHGIKPENIQGKRIVCTLRELSEEFNNGSSEIGNQIK